MARRVSTRIALEGVVKRFGARVALGGVSFTVGAGEVVALLGPNGAGKSTTLGILATLLPFDAGSVTVAGHVFPAQAAAARRALGLVPQQTAVYPTLTAHENLRFFARALGVPRERVRATADRVLADVGLLERADEPVACFSVGMRRRLNLACGIVHEPDVLLLDEPTVGIDPQSRERVFEAVADLARKGTAVLYSTHVMEEAERVCRRVVLLDAGRVVAAGTPAALIASTGLRPRISLRTAQPLPSDWLSTLPGVQVQRGADGAVEVTVPGGDGVPAVVAAAVAAGTTLVELAVHRPNLADAFFALTGRALRDDEQPAAVPA
jgi:ABC-2 type transport system ATP-binding protein